MGKHGAHGGQRAGLLNLADGPRSAIIIGVVIAGVIYAIMVRDRATAWYVGVACRAVGCEPHAMVAAGWALCLCVAALIGMLAMTYERIPVWAWTALALLAAALTFPVVISAVGRRNLDSDFLTHASALHGGADVIAGLRVGGLGLVAIPATIAFCRLGKMLAPPHRQGGWRLAQFLVPALALLAALGLAELGV